MCVCAFAKCVQEAIWPSPKSNKLTTMIWPERGAMCKNAVLGWLESYTGASVGLVSVPAPIVATELAYNVLTQFQSMAGAERNCW